MKIKIRDRLIGEKQPCFVIAEAGVNHNGSLRLAKKLVDVAEIAGADAVKFQTFKAEKLVTKEGKMAEYQKKNIGREESQLEMLKKLELDYSDFIKLKKYCDKKRIIFLSTPHTSDAVGFLESLVPAYKIGSGDLTNIPFLKKVAHKQKPIILSTGMSTLKEIKDAVKSIKRINNKLILLHCTTSYPCPRSDVNLRVMETLRQEFKLPVGYSDHSLGIDVALMAVKLGAVILEKHFTLDRKIEGPDHKASLDPDELKKMVRRIRIGDYPKFNKVVLGRKEKKPTKNELKIAKLARKSITAKQDISKGTIITKGMLEIKRPATGIQPKYLEKVIGKTTRKNIKKDTLIKFDDFL
jgi:N,N'-diacetyllegionaminate synthase